MKGKILSAGLAPLILMSCQMALAVETPDLTGRNIALQVKERPDGEDSKGTMRMTLINKRGKTRERVVLSMSRDYGKDSKTIMVFKSPPDVKGTGFLQYEYDDPAKEDDRWLYLPALKKVRRISGSGKSDYFMGTDFTYDDMGKRSIDEDVHALLREEEYEERKCWVVEAKPKDKDYMYSKKISWIRQDVLIPVRVEFFDKQGDLLKVLTVLEIKKQDNIWTMFRMEMENIRRKHKTILEYQELSFDLGLKDSLFRVSTLERGRIK